MDPDSKGVVNLNIVLEFIVAKKIAYNIIEAKKFLNNCVSCVFKSDFFFIFFQSILKAQIIEISKKMKLLSVDKPFLTASHKLSFIKRKLLISRISPDENCQNDGNNVISGLIKFQQYIRNVFPNSKN